VALALRKVGVTRVHPLAGGLAAWREQGLAVEPITPTSPPSSASAAVVRDP
jgi:3-mercaptopyruvate sulfurtransferase SseA